LLLQLPQLSMSTVSTNSATKAVFEHPVMVLCREEQEVLEAAARQEHKAALAAAAAAAHVNSFHQFHHLNI